eukprot:CAMPEP_0198522390 /NCGR_PEP_ID=MMETSP1462-20131121/21507_1 /TAXON_ID=1333877 /ORGANISM="Brandtodinium nutriculum, Strain RCC3387" /LENGTH=49 /DNA_ID= /DNA_START= /DNA_END= /DNA_ORIENTATION=
MAAWLVAAVSVWRPAARAELVKTCKVLHVQAASTPLVAPGRHMREERHP